MTISKQNWGRTKEGKDVFLFTLSNGKGLVVRLLNYGGIVTSILVPDKTGSPEDVVLGFDTIEGYLGDHPYFGALVGRYCNRIAGGRFSLDGKIYQLARNNGPHHLHGGITGFDKVLWEPEPFTSAGSVGVTLTYLSIDGQEGYPGNLKVKVVYALTSGNELMIDYQAETDRPCPVNLTNHSYFNLKGAGKGDILSHELVLKADRYTAVNGEYIPSGELCRVAGTPFDFNRPTAIGSGIVKVPGGYDHNFILAKKEGEFSLAASVFEPLSGRKMEVFTTEPGVQFYTGNFLDGSLLGKGTKQYQKHAGFCLETQHFPDSPNQPSFPNVIFRPGEKYNQRTSYKFSW